MKSVFDSYQEVASFLNREADIIPSADSMPLVECEGELVLSETNRVRVEVSGQRIRVASRSRLYETSRMPAQYALQLQLYGYTNIPGLSLDWDDPAVQTARRRSGILGAHEDFLERAGLSVSMRASLGLNAKREFAPAWVDRAVWAALELRERIGWNR